MHEIAQAIDVRSLEQLLHPGEDLRTIVFSGGRGQELSSNLAQRFVSPIIDIRSQIETVRPDTPIRPEILAAFDGLDEPDSRFVLDWLGSTTEGRPSAGDWLYAQDSVLSTLGTDLRRISTLKMRPFVLDLLKANLLGQNKVRRILVARDTGQVFKLPQRDSLVYQSHPGELWENMAQQAADLTKAEYGLLMTCMIVVYGRFPTKHMIDIYRTMSILHSLAHSQTVYPSQLSADSLEIKYLPLLFYSIFRMQDFDGVARSYLRNKPGAVDMDEKAVQDRIYLHLTSRRGEYNTTYHGAHSYAQPEPMAHVLKRGGWYHFYSGEACTAGWMEFEDVRRGRIPDWAMEKLMFELKASF